MRRAEPLSLLMLVLFYAAAAAWILARRSPIDYPVYAMAAWGLQRGEAVFRWEAADYHRAATALGFPRYTMPYRYPPLTALLVSPLLGLPDRGMGIWTALQALSAILTAGVLAQWIGAPLGPRGRAVLLLSVGLFPPFLVSLYAGQVNPLATLLIVLSLWAIARGGAGWGGFLLGVSLMLKPLGIGAAALLIWEGRWRALGGLLLGSALALGASALAFGPPALEFLLVSLPATGSAYPPAQNLPSLALRWLTHHPYGLALADDPAAARWAGAALSGTLILLTLAWLGRPGAPRGSFAGRAAWMLCAAFLANPGTWYHHGTVLAPALAVLLRQAPQRPWRWRAALAASAGAVAVWGLAWHAFVGWTPLLDLGTLGTLGLWILLAGGRG